MSTVTATTTTTSEYAQLILAEAVHAVVNGGETQARFEATIAEAIAEERVDPAMLVAVLAMAAAGNLALVAQTIEVSPIEVLGDFIEGMAKGQEQLVPALAAFDASDS